MVLTISRAATTCFDGVFRDDTVGDFRQGEDTPEFNGPGLNGIEDLQVALVESVLGDHRRSVRHNQTGRLHSFAHGRGSHLSEGAKATADLGGLDQDSR